MPVVNGNVGTLTVRTLRDSGCSGIVVKRKVVETHQLTGREGYMRLVDNSVKRTPLAKITIDIPYFTGEVEVLCLQDVIYDLIIGNVPGARAPTTLIQTRITRRLQSIPYTAVT